MTLGRRRFRSQWIGVSGWLVAAAIVLTQGLFLIPSLRTRSSPQASLAMLVGTASPDSRRLQLRPSGGFAWAPFRPATRGTSPESRDLEGAITSTLAHINGESTLVAHHTAGVALLLAGRPREALSRLTAAQALNDASVWNDLAVAFHETAERYDAPEFLADALAACDRALTLDRNFPEALFNRSLVIERLGLRDDARAAWGRYLATDSTSDWASEAREHLASLAPLEAPLDVLDREYEAAQKDPAVAMSLVSRDPMAARGSGIKDVLGRWGRAVSSGDDRGAQRHLAVARQLGAAVARGDGDRMLAESVAVIDAAGNETRSRLAAAHDDYDRGLKALQEYRAADAEAMLRRAASSFEQSGSPLALPARYFAANALFEEGRPDDAARENEQLLATVKPAFPAYRALILWQVGTWRILRADWGAAISPLEQSAALFDRLGEIQNAGAVRRLLAFVHDRIGDPTTAWKYHVAALRGLGRRTTPTLAKEVSLMADAAVLRRDWHTAASFLNLQISMVRRLHDDVQLVDTLLIRAVVRDRLNEAAQARSDIAEARALIPRLADPTYRDFLRVATLRATAMLTATPPGEAEGLLTEAIEFQATRNDSLNLPDLLLQRARARRASGMADGAMADLQHGIAELEQRRRSLPENELRWGAFHAAEELFDEAIDAAISADDDGAAFRFAERARARSLIESYVRSPVLDVSRLPAHTIIIEYAALPSRLVVFIAEKSGVRATTVTCDRARLEEEIDALSRELRESAPAGVKSATAAVYRRLIEPIEPQLLGAATIVFVPDSVTSTVPFSALMNSRGEYLLEQHAIAISPSAAVFAAASARRREGHVPASVLVISTSDAAESSEALVHAEMEAQDIARLYPDSNRLQNDAAELDAVTRLAPDADVVHFAGHAVGDDRGFEPASIILRQNGRERRVEVAEIARIRLRRTSVVVLAGCNTARGERRAAEGVISVAHGFLVAGAPSVIATLWPIDDEAAGRFFPRLHRKLAAGVPAAEALRAVQLESIRRGDIPASLWAAIQDIGS